MRIRYYKPFHPDQLNSLGLPADPTEAGNLKALPTATLQLLVDTVYQQLDSDYSTLEAADWYNALIEVLDQRTTARDGLERPA